MPRPRRVFALAFALIGLPLAAFAAAGVAVALHQIAPGRDAAVAQTTAAMGALVGEAASNLRHEVALLARDRALIEAAARSDWSTLARSGAPRLTALVRDGIVDLVVVRDASGAALVQVPAGWMATTPGVAGPEADVAMRAVNGEVFLLAAASVGSAPGRDDGDRTPPLGTILMGRRLQNVARGRAGDPGRPEAVLVAGDAAAGSTRGVLPAAGWASATAAGRIDIGGETFALRPPDLAGLVSADGTVWAPVPETQFRLVEWKLALWLVAVFAAGGITLALGIWSIVQRPGASAEEVAAGGDGAPGDLEERRAGPRDWEMEASSAPPIRSGSQWSEPSCGRPAPRGWTRTHDSSRRRSAAWPSTRRCSRSRGWWARRWTWTACSISSWTGAACSWGCAPPASSGSEPTGSSPTSVVWGCPRSSCGRCGFLSAREPRGRRARPEPGLERGRPGRHARLPGERVRGGALARGSPSPWHRPGPGQAAPAPGHRERARSRARGRGRVTEAARRERT